MGIIDAIPPTWRKCLKESTYPHHLINNDEHPHIIINEHPKDITQTQSRDIYIKILKSKQNRPPCIDKWNKALQLDLTEKEWKYIFTLPKEVVRDTKIHEMQYKILHRVYATDSTIAHWDHTKNATCNVCNGKANICHNFVKCTIIDNF